MKKILLLTAALFVYVLSFAQTAAIKGVTVDTINKQALPNSAVLLLRAKDSVLIKSVRSNTNGEFEIKNLKGGAYILLVTYPQYADYAESFTLTDTSAINTGPVKLILKAHLLQEVIVKQQLGSIRMKGDTTELIADSFKVQPNATVEDLLKKMPGMQVDKNGVITAQGETVKKVLVEGEEFFGDDPTLVTQNLRADMVERIQVYDKKSDEATLTGIDDGKKDKTINLKLKEGKKNGYFGKITAGGGTDSYQDNQAMLNLFKNKLKLAAYGIISNTGKTGLNWDEINTYGDANRTNYQVNNGDNDIEGWGGQYNGQGYPFIKTGGLHYNDKLSANKAALNLNYKFMDLGLNGLTTTNSQNILSNDTINYNNSYQKYNNRILRNRFSGSYEYQLDSSSSLKIMAGGGSDHKTSITGDSSASFTNDQRVNTSNRSLSSTGDKNTVNSYIYYSKKFKKEGRTLSVDIVENYSDNEANGYLKSHIDTFKNNAFAGSSIIDQYKMYTSKNILFNTKATYTDKFSKSSFIRISYGIEADNSTSGRNSYNKADDGKYTTLDTTYSNHYRFNVFTQTVAATYYYNRKKLRFGVGNNFDFTNFNQDNLHTGTALKRSFVNFNPAADFSYGFTQQRRLYMYYNGRTSQPSIEQLQPVATNDDPLNITVGNANLKPAFENGITLGFYDYKVLQEQSLSMGLSYNSTLNAISSNTTFDALTGKSVTKYINVNGNQSVSARAYFYRKLKKPDLSFRLNGNVQNSKYINVTNNLQNTTNSTSYTGGLGLNKSKENKYSISFDASATYSSNHSTIQLNAPSKYWRFNINPDVDIFLPWKLQLHADGNYNLQQKTANLPGYDAFIVNAWFGKKLLKKDGLLIKVSGNDILNQNVNFQRSVQSNFITQTTYSTIGRYFLLSAVWSFSKSNLTAN